MLKFTLSSIAALILLTHFTLQADTRESGGRHGRRYAIQIDFSSINFSGIDIAVFKNVNAEIGSYVGQNAVSQLNTKQARNGNTAICVQFKHGPFLDDFGTFLEEQIEQVEVGKVVFTRVAHCGSSFAPPIKVPSSEGEGNISRLRVDCRKEYDDETHLVNPLTVQVFETTDGPPGTWQMIVQEQKSNVIPPKVLASQVAGLFLDSKAPIIHLSGGTSKQPTMELIVDELGSQLQAGGKVYSTDRGTAVLKLHGEPTKMNCIIYTDKYFQKTKN